MKTSQGETRPELSSIAHQHLLSAAERRVGSKLLSPALFARHRGPRCPAIRFVDARMLYRVAC
jgi:hypothetical protein